MWFCAAPSAVVCMEIVLRHRQLYHYEVAAALIFRGGALAQSGRFWRHSA